MRNFYTLSFLVLFVPSAGAQDAPTVTLPKNVGGDPGQFITVPATTNGKIVEWVVVDEGLNLFPVELLKDTKTAVVTSVKPGDYRIMAYTALGDVPSQEAICIVTITGPRPPPPPPPPPTPPTPPDPEPPVPPSPVPVSDPLYAVLVYDPAASMTPLPLLYDDPNISGSLKDLSTEWRAIRSSDPEVSRLKLDKFLAGFKLPFVVIYSTKSFYDADGNAHTNEDYVPVPAPKNVDGMIKIINKIRGQ